MYANARANHTHTWWHNMPFLNRIGPGPNELSINIQTGHKIYIFIPFINTTNVLNAGDDLFLVIVYLHLANYLLTCPAKRNEW